MLVTNQLARGFQGAWWGAPRGATNRHHVSRAGPSYDNTFFFFFCMCFVLVWFFEFCLVFLRYSRKKNCFSHGKHTMLKAQLCFHVKHNCSFTWSSGVLFKKWKSMKCASMWSTVVFSVFSVFGSFSVFYSQFFQESSSKPISMGYSFEDLNARNPMLKWLLILAHVLRYKMFWKTNLSMKKKHKTHRLWQVFHMQCATRHHQEVEITFE